MFRKIRIFRPIIVGLGAGAVYLLAKEDMKRKSEGKANFIDAVKQNGVDLIKDKELRDASAELLKTEVAGVADEVSAKAQQVKEFVQPAKDKIQKNLDNIIEEMDQFEEDLKENN